MKKRKYNKKYILGIAVALLVPLSFYIATRILTKDKIVLPDYYMIDHISVVEGEMWADTIYHQLSDMELHNQFGETVHLNSSLQGKILLISFFRTTDTATANTLTRNMTMLQRAFRKKGMKQNDTLAQFLTVSTDSETDQPPVLRSYAEKFSVNQDRWWFLTGDSATIDNLWRVELGLNSSSGQPPHGSIILVDKERFIRGYYNGLDANEVRNCANDIGWLALEKKRNKTKR